MHTKTNLRPISLGLALILATAPIVGCSNKNSSSTQSVTSEAASSQEKKQVDVPNVVGMTSEEAHAALWALNLEDEIMSSNGSKAEASANWKVVQQNPEAGKAAREGDVVKLIVEGQKVSVPDLVGMRCDRAEEALEKLGLEADFKSDSGKTVVVKSNWWVISQDPAAGAEAEAGKEVTLTVSKEAGSTEQQTSENTSASADAAGEPKAADDSISPEFQAAMDSYEAFFNEYADFMKRYEDNPTDAELLAEMGDMFKREGEMLKEFDAWERDDLNTAELAYYLEVQGRIYAKLAEAL